MRCSEKGVAECITNTDATNHLCSQAKEFGQAEAWMNERMMRCSEKSVAEYITAFDGGVENPKRQKRDNPLDSDVWLVWK